MTAVLNNFQNGITATGYAASSVIGPFTLLGGDYLVIANDTGTVAQTLKIADPAGNFIAVGSSTTFSAVGTALVGLPAGLYEIAVGSGATSAIAAVLPVPLRNH